MREPVSNAYTSEPAKQDLIKCETSLLNGARCYVDSVKRDADSVKIHDSGQNAQC